MSDDQPKEQNGEITEFLASRDRFVSVAELANLLGKCKELGDYELRGFIAVAACTGMRKGEVLPRKWDEVRVDDDYPYITRPAPRTESKRLPLPVFAVEAHRAMPSYGKDDYLFPAKRTSNTRDSLSSPMPMTLASGLEGFAPSPALVIYGCTI